MVNLSRNQTFVYHGKFPWKLLVLMMFIRLMDLVLTQSSYVPDEYWQSLEVAHKKAFGYGFLTWEWGKGIRSYFYVAIIYVLYSVTNFLQIDFPELVILLPRIFQGLLSAVADVYFIRFIYEKRSGQYSWGLLSWITSYFTSYCSTRTLINTFEMNLTIMALYHYPGTSKSNSLPFVAILSLLFYVRPTAAVIWFPLVILNIINAKKPLKLILSIYIPVGLAVAMFNAAVDSYFHEQIVFTPLNFFKVNILDNISSYYGSHDLLWYLYIGLPVILGLQTVPFYFMVFSKITKSTFLRSLSYDLESQMIFTVLWSITVFSLIPHKEFRFILPLVPMALYISSGVLGKWSTTAKTWLLYAVGGLLITVHIGLVIFLGRFHNVGPLSAMTFLRNDMRNSSNAKLLFLAPCHSFPLYSHLHSRVPARFLTCTPNFLNETDYMDEAENFYKNPQGWLRSQYVTSQPCTLPTHIIKYDSLNITNFLHLNNYTLTESLYNSVYYTKKTGEYVQIYKRKGRPC